MQWKFKTYVSENGRAEVQTSLNELDERVSIPFQVRLRYLANTPKSDWKRPHAAKLQGVKDVYEIRFKANGVEFRPLGFFGPGDRDFTILVWSSKKQNVWTPADAIDTAEKRRKAIAAGKARCVALKIHGNDFPPVEE